MDRLVKLIVTLPDGESQVITGLREEFYLGSRPGCQARIVHPLMPPKTACFRRVSKSNTFEVTTWRNGGEQREPLLVGQRHTWDDVFQVQIVEASPEGRDHDADLDETLVSIHASTVAALQQTSFDDPKPRDVVAVEDRASLEAQRSSIWRHEEMRVHAAGRLVRAGAEDLTLGAAGFGPDWRQPSKTVPLRESLLARLIQEALELAEGETLAGQLSLLHARFDSWWRTLRLSPQDVDYLADRLIRKAVKELVFGDGPLEDLLASPSLTEIMVTPPRRIYVERDGRIVFTGRQFASEAAVQRVAARIVQRAGRRVDQSSPLADANLPDGSRVHVALPPVAVDGTSLTIRKFPASRMTMNELVSRSAMPPGARSLLDAAVRARLNIVVSGGTGSGKTTLINAMSEAIPSSERVVTIEDTAELRPGSTHTVRLESRTANAEGRGRITILELSRNSLRMRPDRIIIGECRGMEALSMIKAMNTGHDGSMTTVHANSPPEALTRLEALAMESGEANAESVRGQIAGAVQLVVQLCRWGTGRRVITSIAEVTGLDTDGVIRTKPLFAFDPSNGRLRPTGLVSRFSPRLRGAGGLSVATMFEEEENPA